MFLKIVIKIHQITAGIYQNRKISLATKMIIRILIIIAVSGMTIVVFATNEASYRTITLGLFSCIIFSCSLQLITKFSESALKKVTHKLRQDTFSFAMRTINNEAEREMERKFWFWILALIISASAPVFCPYFYFLTKPEIFYDDPDLQIIPFFHTHWKTDTLFEYIAMVILQISICGIMMIAYWSLTMYTIYVVVHLQMHVETLKEEFNKVLNSYMEQHFEEHVVKYDQDFQTNNVVFIRKMTLKTLRNTTEFINVIKYQQFIHRCCTFLIHIV